VKKAGLVFLGVVVLAGAVWFLETVTAPEPASVVEIFPGEKTGLPVPVLLAAGVAGERVHLSWRSVPGALVYHLWRAAGPDAAFEVIFTGRDTTFTDGAGLLPGQNYCYQLTVSDPEIDESGFSEPKCVERNPAGR
jgi:hypothetical protein